MSRANIHVLHTQGLQGGQQGVKECIECWGGPGKHCGSDPRRNGTFDCCDQGTCPVAPGADATPTEYKMLMRLRYTRDVSKVTAVNVETYQAPDCVYEYNALPSGGGPENKVTETWTVDKDKEFLFAVGHMHSGALNVSLFLNDAFVCASYPVHGSTPMVAGDEKGHIVEVTRCLDDGSAKGYPNIPAGSYRNHSLRVGKGDRLRVDGWYWVGESDPRIEPTPAGPHLGVMSYMYAVFVDR